MQGSKVMDEAEVARLTEQVAQLEEALDAARRLLATRVEATRLDEANAEVTRLTEALAAAERQLESFGESTMRLLARAEAAERDRDAALRKLAQVENVRKTLCVMGMAGAAGRIAQAMACEGCGQCACTCDHLSGQPVAPKDRLTQAVERATAKAETGEHWRTTVWDQEEGAAWRTRTKAEPEAPVPVTTCPDCGMVGNACFAHLHVCQPPAPVHTEAALRERVAQLTEDIGTINNDWHVETMRKLAAERDRDAALRKLGELGVWADTYGAALTPHGGAADTYGDGVRACKTQVKAMLSSQPAAPTPESIRAASTQTPGIIDLSAALQESLRQPSAPARTETPELRPGCTRADYYEPTRTESNYSLAELRRIIRAEPGSLTGAELVVRDTMLEMCAPRTEVETVDCESCAIRGIECDNGDHCDSCGRRMDGYVAATADVCHDCWQAAKSRTAAESELTALRRRVARATAALTRNHVARALDALRGR